MWYCLSTFDRKSICCCSSGCHRVVSVSQSRLPCTYRLPSSASPVLSASFASHHSSLSPFGLYVLVEVRRVCRRLKALRVVHTLGSRGVRICAALSRLSIGHHRPSRWFHSFSLSTHTTIPSLAAVGFTVSPTLSLVFPTLFASRHSSLSPFGLYVLVEVRRACRRFKALWDIYTLG